MKWIALIPCLVCVGVAGWLAIAGNSAWVWFLLAGVVLAGVASQMDEP